MTIWQVLWNPLFFSPASVLHNPLFFSEAYYTILSFSQRRIMQSSLWKYASEKKRGLCNTLAGEKKRGFHIDKIRQDKTRQDKTQYKKEEQHKETTRRHDKKGDKIRLVIYYPIPIFSIFTMYYLCYFNVLSLLLPPFSHCLFVTFLLW